MKEKEWKYNVEDCFDENGNFTVKHFDPYRDRNNGNKDFWNALFYTEDCYTWLRYSVESYILKRLKTESHLKWDCDMSALIHYENFACNTKGNYSLVYGWR